MLTNTKIPIMPKKGRKYPTKDKTTTPEGKRNYSKFAMREYRKRKAQELKELKNELNQLRKKLEEKR